MGACSQCQHFRRVKPVSQLLATIFSTTDADISHALNKIVEDEGKQRDEESQYKRAQATAGKSAWAYRPVMSDYCSVNEKAGEYHIAEILNAGLQCSKFEAGKPVRHACAECVHRKEPEGPAKDRSAEELYGKMLVQATSAKASTSQPEALLKSHREGAAARKAFELAGIYAAKGVLPSMPGYASYCGLLSAPDEFVICALYNSHSTCEKWEAAAPAPIAAAVPAPPPVAPPPDGDVLVPGAVPLTRSMAARTAEALGWLLDVHIPPEVAALIQAQLVEDWTKGDAKSISETQQLVSSYDSIAGLNIETRDALREQLQVELVVGLRAQSIPAAEALIRLYDRANAPIAMGNPPLTREIANCFFDLLGLVQALQQGVEWQPLPDPTKLAYSQVLATQYPSLDPTQQAWFGGLPKGWTALRAAWKNATPEQREPLRQQILASLGPIAGQPLAPPPPPAWSPAGPVQLAAPAPPPAPAPDASGSSADDLLSQIIKDGKAEEEKLAKEDPAMALQVRLQNQARNAQLISNMMQMRHETSMTIIRNMR